MKILSLWGPGASGGQTDLVISKTAPRFAFCFGIRRCLAVFLAVAAAHFLLRISLPNYIFDDTRHIYDYYTALGSSGQSLTLSRVLELAAGEFGNSTLREYRPLSFLQHSIINTLYAPSYHSFPWIPALIVSMGWGMLASAYAAFSNRLLGSPGWSILATIVFITSMPVLTGSWIVVMGWQWVVSLSIICGFLCYQNFKIDGKSRWLAAIACIAIIGTWFREYSGMFVFIALANELFFASKRSWRMLVTLVFCAFHVIFPAWLPALFPGGPKAIALVPVFNMGPIATLSAGRDALDVNSIRWEAMYRLVLLMPPLLWVLAVIGIVLRGHLIESSQNLTRAWFGRAVNWLGRGSIVWKLTILLLFGLTFARIVQYKHGFGDFLIVFLFFTSMVLVGAFKSPLLAMYLWVGFLPFLKIYLHEVHLAYSAAPLALLLVMFTKDLADCVARSNGKFAKVLLKPLMVLIVLDGFCNVYASSHAVGEVYRGIRDRAEWLKVHARRDSIVVGNFIDMRDMLLYAYGHFEPYYSIQPGWEKNKVETSEKLVAMFDAHHEQRDIFLLGAVFPRLPWKYNYHHMHYLRILQEGDPNRQQFTTRAVYPYADPLKILIPDELVSYPGPPDLVDDYWFGNERGGRPFLRELRTDYLLVRVESLSLSQRTGLAARRTAPYMIGSYRGFNLFECAEESVAAVGSGGVPGVLAQILVLDQQAGPVDILGYKRDQNFLASRRLGRSFVASSIEEARAGIDALQGTLP